SGIAANFATSTRKDLNEKISSFSLTEINRFSTASLITRSTNDIEQVQMTYLLMMRMIFAAPITAIWAICKVQSASWELSIATVIAVLVLIITLTILAILVMPKFKVSQKYIDKLNGITRENLNGIRVVKAYNAEQYQENKFKTSNDDLTKLNLFTGRVMGLLSPVMIIVMDGITLAIYWIGSYLINGGTLGYNDISSFTMLATQIIMAFMMLLMMFVLWPRASVSAKRINEVLETKPSIVDPVNPNVPKKLGTIEFDDVSFHYPDAEENILEHISFKANQGDTIAIIGPTGCGKTSLVQLLDRLYDVTSGSVKIDGVNVKDFSQKELHSRIGFVPQKGLLFSGTIKSNIGFGLDSQINDEDIENAAKIACADEFIEKMEGKYNSPIAQGGSNVSGGQRQRLCIARAVALKPEIFVFDDSFSALDFKTDLKVRQNLKASQQKATKVIVAQRIGTVMDADLILVLNEGKLVGKGTHKELLSSCELYKEIALSQLSKEELGL
ncbi:MAG TPA: multidrug ABC transporter ATP-binding protein, partial [Firmicutes bacterium]|nr:multidrug ABC transporter ATP-binding protein [Bacillota bacterium]